MAVVTDDELTHITSSRVTPPGVAQSRSAPTRARREPATHRRRLPRWVHRSVRVVAAGTLALVTVAAGPFAWTRAQAADHLHTEADLAGDGGPRADVVIVLGGRVAPGGTRPYNFLQGRLDTAAALLAAGRSRVVLVSGDGNGRSGNETAVMSDYLASIGVDPDRVVADPYGLDTYDSCVRARQVYGITKALVVTQDHHLARAVTLCRHAGIDADGVRARCPDCFWGTRLRSWVRDYFAATKAAWDAWRDRPPAVGSPPSSEIADALSRW